MSKEELYRMFGLDTSPDTPEQDQASKKLGIELLNRIHITLGFRSNQGKIQPLRLRRISYSVAAAILLAIGTFIGFKLYKKTQPAGMRELVTIRVPAGKVQKITLPDQSTVWLNAASVFRYPKTFGKIREVYLDEGEGFFEVKRDTTSAFVVHSSTLNTRVLGTSFRIKSYKALSNIKVSVVSGKVAVDEGNIPLAVLEKDQEITFDKTSKKPVETIVEAKETVQWQSGNVVLKSVHFEDMMLAIENSYGVKIDFDKAVFEKCENSIRFSTRQRLDEVLNLVSDIQDVTYEINGKEVTIKGYGCN
jgi:transmembrane sensor